VEALDHLAVTSPRLALAFASFALALGCGDAGVRPAPAPSYPASAGVAVGAVLPDLAFAGVREGGQEGTVRLRDYFEPGAPEARLLVVRVEGGAWCGTCLWHAGHTGELFALPRGERLRVLDLVVGDRENAPARAADAAAWRSEVDVPDRVAVGADPSFSFRAVVPSGGTVLPMVLLVDTTTMKLVSYAQNPDPVALARSIDAAFAAMDGVAPSPPPDETLADGLFHRNEWDMIRAIHTPGAPPPDPTDAVADDPRAAALGEALFFDAGLSPSGAVSCASCHDPSKGYSDGLPQAHGVGRGDRRTPRIALAAFSRFQFWDGRADSLWSQALGPIENAAEMGSSRVFVARRVASAHATLYRAAFPSHPLPDVSAWPAGGKPGDPAYDGLDPDARLAATRVFVDAGKALEAYERTFRVGASALDAYAGGDRAALTLLEKQGLSVFAGAGCMQCHWGPRLTDDAFHVTRTPTGRADGLADRGRADGVLALASSEFSASGAWSDDPGAAPLFDTTAAPAELGAFKTPSLRGVAGSAYFGHGGARGSLSDVMADYGSGGLDASDPRAAGVREPWLPRFGETTRWSIGTFLSVL
jgi:cytochrome c peroxidase